MGLILEKCEYCGKNMYVSDKITKEQRETKDFRCRHKKCKQERGF